MGRWQAIGVELDLTDKGLGTRSRRYSMLIEDGVVKVLNLEEGGAFTMSGADDIIAALVRWTNLSPLPSPEPHLTHHSTQ